MAWFVGFILSGGIYYVMMLGHKPQPVFEPVSAD
jgi:cytosine/uracil/thiamine/allantoin permease